MQPAQARWERDEFFLAHFLIAVDGRCIWPIENYMSSSSGRHVVVTVDVKAAAKAAAIWRQHGKHTAKRKRDKIKIFYHVHRGIAQYCLLEIIINFLCLFFFQARAMLANQRNSMALNFERGDENWASERDNGIPDRFFIEPQKSGTGKVESTPDGAEWGAATW